MSLDERLSARLASDFAPLALASAPSPFDEPTNALAKRCELAEFGMRQANVDRGFLDGCKLPAFGAMEERERREFTVKEQVWRTVKAWSAADEGREQWSLLAYRHTVRLELERGTWLTFSSIHSTLRHSGICSTASSSPTPPSPERSSWTTTNPLARPGQ